jgi:uncharacterized membrane protein
MRYRKRVALNFVFFWFLIGGIGHFARSDWFVQIVPPYLPQPLLLVWISGAFELLGAAGLLFASTRTAAGNGLALLTVCVTPANVYMLQQHQLFPQFPLSVLVLRLLVQVALIACIIWCTRPKRWRFR